MPPPPAEPACLIVHGNGDCSEFDFCNRQGSCPNGLCDCWPGYVGLSCEERIHCRFWHPERLEWSTEGCTTSATDGGDLLCECSHLTEFGGLSVPTNPADLLAEVTSIQFNTFSLGEAFDVLSDFDFGANPTIYITVFTLAGLDVLSLLFGLYRERRRRLARARHEREYEEEAERNDLQRVRREAFARAEEEGRRRAQEEADEEDEEGEEGEEGSGSDDDGGARGPRRPWLACRAASRVHRGTVGRVRRKIDEAKRRLEEQYQQHMPLALEQARIAKEENRLEQHRKLLELLERVREQYDKDDDSGFVETIGLYDTIEQATGGGSKVAAGKHARTLAMNRWRERQRANKGGGERPRRGGGGVQARRLSACGVDATDDALTGERPDFRAPFAATPGATPLDPGIVQERLPVAPRLRDKLQMRTRPCEAREGLEALHSGGGGRLARRPLPFERPGAPAQVLQERIALSQLRGCRSRLSLSMCATTTRGIADATGTGAGTGTGTGAVAPTSSEGSTTAPVAVAARAKEKLLSRLLADAAETAPLKQHSPPPADDGIVQERLTMAACSAASRRLGAIQRAHLAHAASGALSSGGCRCGAGGDGGVGATDDGICQERLSVSTLRAASRARAPAVVTAAAEAAAAAQQPEEGSRPASRSDVVLQLAMTEQAAPPAAAARIVCGSAAGGEASAVQERVAYVPAWKLVDAREQRAAEAKAAAELAAAREEAERELEAERAALVQQLTAARQPVASTAAAATPGAPADGIVQELLALRTTQRLSMVQTQSAAAKMLDAVRPPPPLLPPIRPAPSAPTLEETVQDRLPVHQRCSQAASVARALDALRTAPACEQDRGGGTDDGLSAIGAALSAATQQPPPPPLDEAPPPQLDLSLRQRVLLRRLREVRPEGLTPISAVVALQVLDQDAEGGAGAVGRALETLKHIGEDGEASDGRCGGGGGIGGGDGGDVMGFDAHPPPPARPPTRDATGASADEARRALQVQRLAAAHPAPVQERVGVVVPSGFGGLFARGDDGVDDLPEQGERKEPPAAAALARLRGATTALSFAGGHLRRGSVAPPTLPSASQDSDAGAGASPGAADGGRTLQQALLLRRLAKAGVTVGRAVALRALAEHGNDARSAFRTLQQQATSQGNLDEAQAPSPPPSPPPLPPLPGRPPSLPPLKRPSIATASGAGGGAESTGVRRVSMPMSLGSCPDAAALARQRQMRQRWRAVATAARGPPRAEGGGGGGGGTGVPIWDRLAAPPARRLSSLAVTAANASAAAQQQSSSAKPSKPSPAEEGDSGERSGPTLWARLAAAPTRRMSSAALQAEADANADAEKKAKLGRTARQVATARIVAKNAKRSNQGTTTAPKPSVASAATAAAAARKLRNGGGGGGETFLERMAKKAAAKQGVGAGGGASAAETEEERRVAERVAMARVARQAQAAARMAEKAKLAASQAEAKAQAKAKAAEAKAKAAAEAERARLKAEAAAEARRQRLEAEAEAARVAAEAAKARAAQLAREKLSTRQLRKIAKVLDGEKLQQLVKAGLVTKAQLRRLQEDPEGTGDADEDDGDEDGRGGDGVEAPMLTSDQMRALARTLGGAGDADDGDGDGDGGDGDGVDAGRSGGGGRGGRAAGDQLTLEAGTRRLSTLQSLARAGFVEAEHLHDLAASGAIDADQMRMLADDAERAQLKRQLEAAAGGLLQERIGVLPRSRVQHMHGPRGLGASAAFARLEAKLSLSPARVAASPTNSLPGSRPGSLPNSRPGSRPGSLPNSRRGSADGFSAVLRLPEGINTAGFATGSRPATAPTAAPPKPKKPFKADAPPPGFDLFGGMAPSGRTPPPPPPPPPPAPPPPPPKPTWREAHPALVALVASAAAKAGATAEQAKQIGATIFEQARNEHTLINFVTPPEDEEALTEMQVVQLFWNTLMLELVLICLLYEPEEDCPPYTTCEPEPPIPVIQSLIIGAIVSGITFTSIYISRRVFRWGNQRKMPPRRERDSRLRRLLRRALVRLGCIDDDDDDDDEPLKSRRRSSFRRRASALMKRRRSSTAATTAAASAGGRGPGALVPVVLKAPARRSSVVRREADLLDEQERRAAFYGNFARNLGGGGGARHMTLNVDDDYVDDDGHAPSPPASPPPEPPPSSPTPSPSGVKEMEAGTPVALPAAAGRGFACLRQCAFRPETIGGGLPTTGKATTTTAPTAATTATRPTPPAFACVVGAAVRQQKLRERMAAQMAAAGASINEGMEARLRAKFASPEGKAALAQRELRMQLRWRHPAVYRCRMAAAWAVSLGAFAICAMFAVVYGRLFGKTRTNDMLKGWLLASCQTWGIVEPIQVIMLALLPLLIREDSRCGRCFERARAMYNEVFA